MNARSLVRYATWRERPTLGWGLVALIGLAFLVGPAVTHRQLTAAHVTAHLLTGPAIILLAVAQILAARRGRSRRLVDAALALCGVWLVALPFVLPAPGLHVHGHAAAGIVVSAASLWNVLAPPRRPS